MGKMVAPDRGIKETVIGGAKYNPDRGGLYSVDNPKHIEAMKREGYFEASLMGATGRELGYTCAQCGFGSWFRKCSRCGHEATTPSRDGE